MKKQRLWQKIPYYLRILCIAVLFFPVLSCNITEEIPKSWDTAQPLHEIYQNDFLIGNIISPGDLNTVRFNYLKRHFNTVTAENHMKPENIAPNTRPANDNWAYQWTNADRIVNAARAEGMGVVGHILIWHSQTPPWLTRNTNGTALDRETVLYNLEKYVTDVADHFKGKLIAWDVVNEAMRDGLSESDAADWKNCQRPITENGWRAIGPEYIEKAFLAARAADPGVKLYYNDYSLNNANKARAVYNMVNDINTRYPNVEGRKLIDGIGMQSHHRIYTVPQTVETSIQLFASLGVEIAISELDIIAAGGLLDGSPPWNDNAARLQAAQYAAMFRIFKNHTSVIKRVTFWGIDDGTSWRSASHPTLLNADYSLKPAFHAVTNPHGY